MANLVLQNSKSRVFLIEGRAGPDSSPDYHSCLRMTGLTQGFGDIERVECPDPYQYGKFIEVAQLRGAAERVTTTLEGRYYMDALSTLLRLARQNCAVDVQLHLGSCTDPSEFDTFEKAIILEEAFITSFGTEDLGTLQSADNAVVNETVDISAKAVYEVRKLTFAEKAASQVVNEIVDIVYADVQSCGSDCEDESAGCNKIYAVSKAAGGSPATTADIIFSTDGGTTWYSHDIDTITAGEEPNALAPVGSYIVVVSEQSGSYHYVAKSSLNSYTDPSFTEVAITGGAPRAIFSLGNLAFVVGNGGYVYKLGAPASGTTTLDAGSATTDTLLDVFALDSNYAVAVGQNGAVVYTTNGVSWAAATRPVGAGIHLNCVWMRSKTEWWVGTSGGRVYYTKNSGTTWTEKSFTGSGSGNVTDIDFATGSIGYISHTTAGNVGRILRTYNGGNSWIVLPEGTSTMPTSQRFNAIAPCAFDANTIVAGGLGVASDGIIVLGTSS